jgi:hypothetical protein
MRITIKVSWSKRLRRGRAYLQFGLGFIDTSRPITFLEYAGLG